MIRMNFVIIILLAFITVVGGGCDGEGESSGTPPGSIDAEPFDLVIVLGLQLNYSDCSPRKVMEYRVARAVEYAATVPHPHYLLSGKGNGITQATCAALDPPITEASAMAEILVTQYGVNPAHITLEENSTNTVQNSIESKKIVDMMVEDGVNITSMALISSNYHMHRGNATNDQSAIGNFNNAFGTGTFIEGVNTFESSKMEQAAVWLPDDLGVNNGWNTEDHVRLLGDVDGDGDDDIVAIGDLGVFVALSDGSQFDTKALWLDCAFGASLACGDWDNSNHVRTVGDVDGDGLVDLVGFYNDVVLIHRSDGTRFGSEQVWLADFGLNNGWSTTTHIRTVADVNGDTMADIVAFGDDDVFVALSNGTRFDARAVWSDDLTQGDGWETNEHVRVLADVDGDAMADIVAFGNDKVFVARSTGSAFETKSVWLPASRVPSIDDGNSSDFVRNRGYRVDTHPRGAADIDGDSRADLWAIGTTGVFVALSTGELFEHVGGTWYYESQNRHLGENAFFNHFTAEAGWTVADHPRVFGDVDGNGMADLTGFHNDNVLVSLMTEP